LERCNILSGFPGCTALYGITKDVKVVQLLPVCLSDKCSCSRDVLDEPL
jgi:hypothetical protein